MPVYGPFRPRIIRLSFCLCLYTRLLSVGKALPVKEFDATPTAAPAADRPTSLSLPLALLSLTVLALFRGGQERRAHIKPLTREEVTVLLREAESCYPVIFPLLLCAVGADLRLGEVIGLQWGDADFRGGG